MNLRIETFWQMVLLFACTKKVNLNRLDVHCPIYWVYLSVAICQNYRQYTPQPRGNRPCVNCDIFSRGPRFCVYVYSLRIPLRQVKQWNTCGSYALKTLWLHLPSLVIDLSSTFITFGSQKASASKRQPTESRFREFMWRLQYEGNLYARVSRWLELFCESVSLFLLVRR